MTRRPARRRLDADQNLSCRCRAIMSMEVRMLAVRSP
jgi:hypothetical protein